MLRVTLQGPAQDREGLGPCCPDPQIQAGVRVGAWSIGWTWVMPTACCGPHLAIRAQGWAGPSSQPTLP